MVENPGALSVGDVDGDGDHDIASADRTGPVVMRNEGAFEFTRIQGSADFGTDFHGCLDCEVLAVQLGDHDGDGALDLAVVLAPNIFGGDGTWVAVQRNDGSGVFGEAALSKVSDEGYLGRSKLNGDINGDSRSDFVLVREHDAQLQTHVLLAFVSTSNAA